MGEGVAQRKEGNLCPYLRTQVTMTLLQNWTQQLLILIKLLNDNATIIGSKRMSEGASVFHLPINYFYNEYYLVDIFLSG